MKFRKKPALIEAIRLENSHKGLRDALEFMGQEVGSDNMTQNKFDEFYEHCCKEGGLAIRGSSGDHFASFADGGDYIVKGVRGEIYTCKPDVFNSMYEAV